MKISTKRMIATALVAAACLPALAQSSEPFVDTYPAHIVMNGEAPVGPLVSGYIEEGAAERLDKQLTESGAQMVYVAGVSYGQLEEVIKIRNVIKKHHANTAAVELGCVNLCWPILAAGKERYVRAGQLLGLTWFGGNNSRQSRVNDLQIEILRELNVEEQDVLDFASTQTHRTYFFYAEQAVESGLVTKTWNGPLSYPQPHIQPVAQTVSR